MSTGRNPKICGPLIAASSGGHLEVFKLLLAHPDINVNLKDREGCTPFLWACLKVSIPMTRLLLSDPRVNTAAIDRERCSATWCAAMKGSLEIIEWLIESGRDLGDLNERGAFFGLGFTTVEVAEEYGFLEVVFLLQRFMNNPQKTRCELRVKLGVLDGLAAEVFALTVFLCDDLLQPKPAIVTSKFNSAAAAVAAVRFFAIAGKLPMELQMVLCHRVVGSTKQNILHKNSEAAFKSLARFLVSQ